jgi:hypothetical protein
VGGGALGGLTIKKYFIINYIIDIFFYIMNNTLTPDLIQVFQHKEVLPWGMGFLLFRFLAFLPVGPLGPPRRNC